MEARTSAPLLIKHCVTSGKQRQDLWTISPQQQKKKVPQAFIWTWLNTAGNLSATIKREENLQNATRWLGSDAVQPKLCILILLQRGSTLPLPHNLQPLPLVKKIMFILLKKVWKKFLELLPLKANGLQCAKKNWHLQNKHPFFFFSVS